MGTTSAIATKADQKRRVETVVGVEPSTGKSRRQRPQIHGPIESAVGRVALGRWEQRANQCRQIPFEQPDSVASRATHGNDRQTERQHKVSNASSAAPRTMVRQRPNRSAMPPPNSGVKYITARKRP